MTSRLVALFAVLLFLPKVSEAQSSLQDSLSVPPVPGLGFGAFVESVTQDGSRESVVAELLARASGGKARPGEAVLLAMLLNEAGYSAQALTVLRQNALRHPTDRMSLSALAREFGDGRYFDEEEAVLRQLYELPAPPHVRLVCLRQLAMALQDHGRLRALRDAMVKQRNEQPNDAYGWLELAVVQARAGEEEESRGCVYEASKLRPKDVLLLGEIARREAGFGLYTEALRTLDEADKVAKSGNTELLRCLIWLGSGEEAKALATLKNLTLPADADPELVLATADALAQSQLWSSAVHLLDQALVPHATNYQMQYLRAVALEEMGKREAAVTAFIAMMRQATEMPTDESPWFGRRYRGALSGRFGTLVDSGGSWEGLALPSGTLGILHSRGFRFGAYSYRQSGSGMSACYAYTQVEDAPPEPFIAWPDALLTAKHLAVAHLQRLLPCVADARRTEAEKALVAGGLEQPEVLLDPAGIQAPGTLLRHRRDLAAHAALLIDSEYEDSHPLEILDAEVVLFRDGFPQLAFIAACRAYHAAATLEAGVPASATQSDSAAARRALALSLAEQVSACPRVIDAVLGLLPRRESSESAPGAEASAEEYRIIARAVELALQLPVMNLGARATAANAIVQDAVRRGALSEAIRLLRAIAQTSVPTAERPPGLPLGKPEGASMPQPLTELGITHPVLAVLATQSGGPNARRVLSEPALSKARALLAQVNETDIRRTLQLFIGDFSEIEAELKQRLAQPQPTLADHMLAVWFAGVQHDNAEKLKHLADANALTRDAGQVRLIDQDVLNSINRDTEKLSDSLRKFAISAIRRLQAVELLPAFSERSHEALTSIGTLAEAEQMVQREQQERQARHPKADWMAYSRAAAYEQYQARANETTQRLIAALKARNVPAIAALGRVWHWGSPDGTSSSREEMETLLGGPEAFKQLLQASKPAADSGEASQLRYAERLIEYGDAAAALQIYTEMEECDAHAIQPRLRAAFQLAEDDPNSALAHLRSIHLESAQAGMNGASPLAMFVSGHGTSAHRVAVARLLTRWLGSSPDPAPLFDRQTCINLIQIIQEGEREGPARFPYLNQAEDYDGFIIPTGPGVEAMKQARQAHDDLCRAMLRLPQAQPTALAALASLILNDGGDLSDCARLAAGMLHDSVTRQPLREWLTASGAAGEMYAGGGFIAVPSPMTIMVRHAAQTKDFTTFEKVGLPLIEQALGTRAATSARLYARLFSAPDSEYPAAATAWLATRSRRENPNVRSFNEVFNVWQQRALRADLTDVLLKSDAARYQLELGNVPETLKRYVIHLVKSGRQEEGIAFVKALRDHLISSDAKERRRLIAAWQAQQVRYHSVEYEEYRRLPTPEASAFVGRFATWLQHALRDPALICLLPLGFEEGLLGGTNGFSSVAYQMVTPEMQGSPAAVIALAENLGFLADAPGWHNYVLSPYGEPHTWISSLAERVRDAQNTQPLRERLAARQPQTLGSEIFAALLAHSRNNLIEIGKRTSTDKRDELLYEVLTRRQAELVAIPQAQRRAFSLLLRKELPGYPDVSKFDAGLAAALQPFLDAEADDLLPELERLLGVKEWADVGMKVNEFTWRFPETLAQAVRRHPAKAEQVARHLCELMRKTPEDEKQRHYGSTTNTPVAVFIKELGKVPQLLGMSMSLAESEKLQMDPQWMENFAYKLTDYELMRNHDHVAAIFTHSPLVADAAHFKDFAVPSRGDYDGVTLLDKVVTALNHDDVNAQWLHQRLKAAPEQTFGIQLTLALLDSAAPIRKIKGYSNTARRDPAPLIAFAAAHSKDLSQLSPAAAKVVRTLLDHYLKPPDDKPAQRNLLNDDPFGAPPLR